MTWGWFYRDSDCLCLDCSIPGYSDIGFNGDYAWDGLSEWMGMEVQIKPLLYTLGWTLIINSRVLSIFSLTSPPPHPR